METTMLEFTSTLPIHEYHQEIVAAVDANQVTIITAETGAGKSTQVPQYLAEHGYEKIIVTQPRILAARSLASRVREECAIRMAQDTGEYVGYRTAYERDDTENTVILYCTDGLQLVREITGLGTGKRQILILDEVHEWNENMEVLVAWAKKRCQEEAGFKIVVMSATIDAAALATYFRAGTPISVPGRSYDISKRRGRDLVEEVARQIQIGGRNVLVFLPGKSEIEAVTEKIGERAAAKDIPILPLHSQLEAEEQQLVFTSYPHGKIILATNIAQTSITIDDIDVVIDSGLQRRSEVQDGVEGLFINQVSQADCLQRAGRTGRPRKGEYILAPLERLPCATLESRPAYASPEILRKLIDRLALRLASADIDIEELEFYHQPSQEAIAAAKQRLQSLGALTEEGKVTPLGREMERFPVESSYARMLVEAGRYDKVIQAKLVAIIAIQEVGGIVRGGTRYSDWRHVTKQTQSDFLAHYDVYLALPSIDPETYEDLGIIAKNITKAQEVIERLSHDSNLDLTSLTPIETGEQAPLIQCIVAGLVDHLWLVGLDGMATHVTERVRRELSSSIVVTRPAVVVGMPFDLQVPTPYGLEILRLVQGVTIVDPRNLEAINPHVFTVQPGKAYFDNAVGRIMMQWTIKVHSTVIGGVSTPIVEPTLANQQLFIDLYTAWLYKQLENERRYLQRKYDKHLAMVPIPYVHGLITQIVQGVISIAELSATQRGALATLGKLQTYLGEEQMQKLMKSHTSRHHRNHSRSHHLSARTRNPHRRRGRR